MKRAAAVRRMLGYAVSAVVAACAPSTFDGITGASSAKDGQLNAHAAPTKPDESLRGLDPRSISPLSTSWVNTARPRFKWELQAGTTGAMIELSRTPDFKDAKRYNATGTEYTVTEDLEPGVWFWHLQARTDRPGVSFGPTWEVLVRGPTKIGKSSDAPSGGIVDLNGDGVPDLTTVVSMTTPANDDGTGPLVQRTTTFSIYGLDQGGGKPFSFDALSTNDKANGFGEAATADAQLAGGFDLDGDGVGDIAVADIFPPAQSDPLGGGEILVLYGSATNGWPDYASIDTSKDELIFLPSFDKIPTIGAGDFNGDGFGDVSVILSTAAMMAEGTANGAQTMIPFENGAGLTPPSTFAMASGDFDGDGISDVAYTPYDLLTPIKVARGDKVHFEPTPTPAAGSGLTALPTRATAVATGDFDGDGTEELAFATTVNGSPAVCVHSPKAPSLSVHACWVSPSAIDGFGTKLGAGDFDGDGLDDILVASAGGYTLLTHVGSGYGGDDSVFTATKVEAPPIRTSFTVIHPGRPGKAQWAAYGADGKTLYVLSGVDPKDIVVQSFDFKQLKAGGGDFVEFGTAIR